MLRRLSAALALLCTAVPLGAQSVARPFGAVGIGAPMNALGDVSEPGIFANAGVSIARPGSELGWRAEVVYAPFGSKRASFGFGEDGISFRSNARVIGALGSATYQLGTAESQARPYLLGGLGLFSTRVEASVSGIPEFGTFRSSDSKASVGLQFGGGMTFPLGGASAFVEGRYLHILRGAIDMDHEGTDVRWKGAGFVPLTVGLTFGR